MTTTAKHTSTTKLGKTWLVRLHAVMAATTLAACFGSTPTADATVLGGLNIESYCQKWHGGTYHAALRWKGVHGWRCTNGNNDRGVNFSQACGMQYGNHATAFYQDYNNPYSWRCGRPG